MKHCFLLLLLSLSALCLSQSAVDYTNVPDKAYLHLDKTLYAQGDTIWSKAYVFHRTDNTLSDQCYALHAQILDKNGVDKGSYKILVVGGLGYGFIPLSLKMKPGFYQLIVHSSYMKNFNQDFFYKTKFEVRSQASETTIKPLFDKASYKVGDTARITFRMFDEYQEPVPKQRLRYEYRCGDEVLSKKILKCNEEGIATVLLNIDKGATEKPPYLELSYYEDELDDSPTYSQVYMPMANEKVVVGIYPEGGDIVQGINNRIAFEVTDVIGQPLEAMLSLFENGEQIGIMSTMHDGMGFFSLMARDAQYELRVKTKGGLEDVIKLAAPIAQGYNMTYVRQDDEKVIMSLQHSFEGEQSVSIWISQNDVFIERYNTVVNGSRVFSFPKGKIPTGLVTFSVTDKNNVPVSERMVYVTDNQEPMQISIPNTVYSQRKKIDVSIKVPGVKGKAYLSAAVVDSVLGNSPYIKASSIGAYAILESELRSPLHNSDTYMEDGRAAEMYRNLLCMTHGWTRYNWFKNRQALDSLTTFDFNRVEGRVTRFDKGVAKASLTGLVLGEAISFGQVDADEEGRFSIYPSYDQGQSKNVVVTAKSAKGRDNVTVNLINRDTLLFSYIVDKNKDILWPLVYDYNRYIEEESVEPEVPFKLYETKLLTELVVYGDVNAKHNSNTLPTSVSAFAAGSISGDQLDGGFTFSDFVEQATSKAMYDMTLDVFTVRSVGVVADDSEEFGAETVGALIYVNDDYWGIQSSALDFLVKEDIAEIVVMDPTMAMNMYGPEALYGVIFVSTYSDISAYKNQLDRNKAVFGHFISSRDFYSPDFAIPAVDSAIVSDQRVTLHWEPWIKTDENGEANFSFYTDDVSGRKQIVIQGLDDGGHFYHQKYSFDVHVVGP